MSRVTLAGCEHDASAALESLYENSKEEPDGNTSVQEEYAYRGLLGRNSLIQ